MTRCAQPRRVRGRRQGDRGAGAAELAVVMTAVLALFALVLTLGMRWLAAQAADAAAQRALEVAQAAGGTDNAADQVATGIARSSQAITTVTTTVHRGDTTVSVDVTVTALLGGAVTRTATGPSIRFLPQTAGPGRTP
ncbi:hypothetical protein I6A60_24725 [Frankia sp. AgB1.9]|uniref:hypothetical protein n=1 Tax=unclassified Frankia TaxID=2632575 RepID=UPI00193164BC|nr:MULTISPECIES: hypothetical protein [unclassified Frankia]MBL7487437.1 hypothetical protein [Frankia sp. AgW1.1]MBL7551045.1 hypothetical protein [Frankia sp. AgB1.9]MBL7618826.1 hypothetical protein [Frankia sp. AgB1.8]